MIPIQKNGLIDWQQFKWDATKPKSPTYQEY